MNYATENRKEGIFMVKFSCGIVRKLEFEDSDSDNLFIDDIFRSDAEGNDKLQCVAEYLAEIGARENITAGGDPTDPRRMTWKIDGKDTFTLIKGDQTLNYEEASGEKIPNVLHNGYGMLFGLNPWLVKSDAAKGVDSTLIRNPSYWHYKYLPSAQQPIPTDSADFNTTASLAIDKVDYDLDELPEQMTKTEVADLIYKSFYLGANAHITGEPPQGLGAGGFIYTGDLDTKSVDNKWTLRDWLQTASEFGLNVTTTVSADGKGFKLDFSKSVTDPKENVTIGHGIIVNQADLRAIPSLKSCYASPAPNEDDACQYHRPHIEPVRILWVGKNWSFVKTQQEYGWVQNKDLAIATRKDVDKLLNGTAVVREFVFEEDGTRFGMGTRLPFVGMHIEKGNGLPITVSVPKRGYAGRLVWEDKDFSMKYFTVAPSYTYGTVVTALLREIPEGVWLLANKPFQGVEGVDCSGATKMAIEIAGLLLGRNSGSAQALAGTRMWERPQELYPIKETSTDKEKLSAAWNENLKKLEESKTQIRAVFSQWDSDMRHGFVRGPLLFGWNGHVGIFVGLDDAGRAIVVSSLSRTKKISQLNSEEPYASTTEDVWFLGPTVTPLETIETDLATGATVPLGGGMPISWYGRINFIRELK